MRSLGNLTTLGTISLKRQGGSKRARKLGVRLRLIASPVKSLLNRRGQTYRKPKDISSALSLFARQQQAKSWEIRAAMSMAAA
jgi:hypothetical protein